MTTTTTRAKMTPKEQETLDFLLELADVNHYPLAFTTYRHMADHFGVGVPTMRLRIASLRAKGWVDPEPVVHYGDQTRYGFRLC
jgi:DNA-binding FadR family transcriptional regulator